MRCYEAYCYFKNKLDEECKSERTMQRVKQYVEFMESKGVEFSKKKTDKMLFLKLQDKFGSEYRVTQPSVLTQRAVKCANPNCGMGTHYPIEKEGKLYCSEKCANKGEPAPKVPRQPERTEKKTYEETPEYRRAKMRPHVSKMEERIRLRLAEKGIPFETGIKFCLVETEPDFVFRQVDKVVYLDGEKVHRKREAKDEFLREKLQKRHNVKAVGIVYKDNSIKSENEIFEKIVLLQEAKNHEA